MRRLIAMYAILAGAVTLPVGALGCFSSALEEGVAAPPTSTTSSGGSGGAGASTGGSGNGGGSGGGGQGAGGGSELSCTSVNAPPSFPEGSQLLTRPFHGVEVLQRFTTTPRPLSYTVLKIDPAAEGIRFAVTPPNGDAPLETTKQSASDFLRAEQAQLAINAHFFQPWPAPSPDPGYADLQGIAASAGEACSPFQDDALVGLNLDASNVPTIIRAPAGQTSGFGTEPEVTLYNTLGAHAQIVTAGVNTAGDSPARARTAIGLTATGILVAIVVDGEQLGRYEGMTLAEVADLLIEPFGVVDAINLDGGGSTTLSVADPVVHTMNVPGDLGFERIVGSHLGVFADACRGTGGGTDGLIAYEGFDYGHRGWGTSADPSPVGGGLAFALGGSGWATAWLDDWAEPLVNGVAVYPADVGTGNDGRLSPLGFVDPQGHTLLTVGGQARTSFGAASSSRRFLDLARLDPSLLRTDGQLGADGTTLWLSFLAQSFDAAGDYRFAYIELGDQLRLGKVPDVSGAWGLADESTVQQVMSSLSTGEPVFFVARIDFHPGPEDVSVWLNPPLATDPAPADAMTAAVGDLAFAYLDLEGRYSTDFDELRLGTSFAAVAPQMP